MGHQPGVSGDERIARMLDQHEIREVLVRYCRGIDRQDDDLIRSAYHPDAWEHHGAFRGRDIEDFLGYARDRSGLFERVAHYICNQYIELAGDVAHSETYAIALHQSRTDGEIGHTIFGGRYLDRMERRDGRWAIADRVVVCDWSRVDAVTPWERASLFAPAAEGRADLSYDREWPGRRLRAALGHDR
jgi:hypothetical protein